MCLSAFRVGDVFEGGAGGGQKACALRKELGDLARLEKSLDELIHSSTAQLKQLTEFEENKRYPLHFRGSFKSWFLLPFGVKVKPHSNIRQGCEP